jgi:hypothetical protein
MLETWCLTVCGLTLSVAAMSAFVCRWRLSVRTSSSRGVGAGEAEREHGLAVVVSRQDEDPWRIRGRLQQAAELDAARPARQLVAQQHQVGRPLSDQAESVGDADRLADDAHARRGGEEGAQALPSQRIPVDHQHAKRACRCAPLAH